METTEKTTIETKTGRSPATSALALVCVIALILLGMALAVYAVRFLPSAMSGLGEAAVSLSRVFTPGNEGDVEVIDQPATPREPGLVVTIPIGEPTAPASDAPATPTTPAPTYVPPTYTVPTRPVVVPVPSTGGASTGYGSPDLRVEILEVGYVTRDGDSSTFRASSRVPRGEQGAVRFRLANIGTNSCGAYEYEVTVKNDDNRTDTATGRAPALGAGQSVVTYAYFDARVSGDVEIDIEIDSDDDVRESNERNNTDSEEVSVRD